MGNAINIKNLCVWPLTSDDTTDLTYGTKTDLANRFMTFTDTPKQKPAKLEGDGNVIDEYVGKQGGELTLNITSLSAAERVALFGEKATNGSNAMGKNDIIPYVCVAFTVENSDGTLALYKYPKVKLVEQPISVEQRSEGGIKYSTTSLKGDYTFTINEGNARHIMDDIDTVADATIVTAWYATADYFAPAGA